MVRKLFKHEFAALGRVLLPTCAVLPAIAACVRLLLFFETDTLLFNILFTSTVTALVVACVVVMVLTSAMVVVRFYRNLFTSEGYLSFTLPVTPTQHLWVKLLSALLFELIALVAVLLAAVIATEGELLVEIFRAAAYYVELILHGAIGAHFWGYLAEVLVLLPVLWTVQLLTLYACMTVGQLAKKNRILLAVGVYFAYTSIMQTLSSTVTFILPILGEEFWEPIASFIGAHPHASAHMALIGAIVFSAAFGVLLFFICRHILNRRLNLE